jgi:site-specific DNA-methyltransferase (adenine-specific)
VTPYYQDSLVTIYHGDARDVLPTVTADVLVTDPPYGVNLGSHGAANETRRHNALAKRGYGVYEDTPENFDAVVVPIIRAALAMTVRGAVFCAGHMVWRLPPASAVGGVYLPAATGRTKWGYNSLSICLLYGTAPDLHKGAKPIAIRSTSDGDRKRHPCAKPTEWMRWLVALATRPGEMVLDPFMGSGSTLVASKSLGRRAIGIEIEERYCEEAAECCSQEVLGLVG